MQQRCYFVIYDTRICVILDTMYNLCTIDVESIRYSDIGRQQWPSHRIVSCQQTADTKAVLNVHAHVLCSYSICYVCAFILVRALLDAFPDAWNEKRNHLKDDRFHVKPIDDTSERYE